MSYRLGLISVLLCSLLLAVGCGGGEKKKEEPKKDTKETKKEEGKPAPKTAETKKTESKKAEPKKSEPKTVTAKGTPTGPKPSAPEEFPQSVVLPKFQAFAELRAEQIFGINALKNDLESLDGAAAGSPLKPDEIQSITAMIAKGDNPMQPQLGIVLVAKDAAALKKLKEEMVAKTKPEGTSEFQGVTMYANPDPSIPYALYGAPLEGKNLVFMGDKKTLEEMIAAYQSNAAPGDLLQTMEATDSEAEFVIFSQLDPVRAEISSFIPAIPDATQQEVAKQLLEMSKDVSIAVTVDPSISIVLTVTGTTGDAATDLRDNFNLLKGIGKGIWNGTRESVAQAESNKPLVDLVDNVFEETKITVSGDQMVMKITGFGDLSKLVEQAKEKMFSAPAQVAPAPGPDLQQP